MSEPYLIFPPGVELIAIPIAAGGTRLEIRGLDPDEPLPEWEFSPEEFTMKIKLVNPRTGVIDPFRSESSQELFYDYINDETKGWESATGTTNPGEYVFSFSNTNTETMDGYVEKFNGSVWNKRKLLVTYEEGRLTWY